MTEFAEERCPWCGSDLESYTPPPPPTTGFLAEVHKELQSAAKRAGVERSHDRPWQKFWQNFRCQRSGCGYMCAVPVEDDPIP